MRLGLVPLEGMGIGRERDGFYICISFLFFVVTANDNKRGARKRVFGTQRPSRSHVI